MFNPHDLYTHGYEFSTFTPTRDDVELCCFCDKRPADPLYALEEGCSCAVCALEMAEAVVDGVVDVEIRGAL